MPALNEADALPAALAGRPTGYRYVVVDNGSTDGTGEVARGLGVEVVVEPRRGFGAACWAGLQAAAPAHVVVFVDADATFDWVDLPALVAPIAAGEVTLALGRRVRARREKGAMLWHVAVANAVLGRLCGLLAGVPVHDISPFRAVHRAALLDLGLRDRSYGWPLEMILRVGGRGLAVVEVPVAYRDRTGTSKVTGRPITTVRVAARMAGVLLAHARGAGYKAESFR